MVRLLIVAAVLLYGFKVFTGHWPWEPKPAARAQSVIRARQLLGVSAVASREDIIEAHKRLLALVHPDRGGSSAAVHEANAARDTLLGELPQIP
jgi:hypothetical protein